MQSGEILGGVFAALKPKLGREEADVAVRPRRCLSRAPSQPLALSLRLSTRRHDTCVVIKLKIGDENL